MDAFQWKKIKNFSPSEKFGDPMKMDFTYMVKLDTWRQGIPFKIQVLCGWDTTGHTKGSYHYQGRAIDCRLIGATLEEHFFYWLHSPFGGSGLYTWGAGGPFLHLDDRPQLWKKTLWVSFKQGEYLAFDQVSLKRLIDLFET